MFLYGGLGLLIGGLILTFFADKIVKDAEKAAKAKKQGPLLAGVGVIFLVLAVVIGGMLG